MGILGKSSIIDLKSEAMSIKSMEYIEIDTPNFNYEEIGLDLEQQNELKNLAKIVIGSKEKIKFSIIEFINALDRANDIFPKDGSFSKWCKAMNLKKDEVSLFYKKKQIHSELKIPYEKIEKLPQLVVKEITNKKNNFNEEELKSILDSEIPSKKIKELKKEKNKKDFSVATEKSLELKIELLEKYRFDTNISNIDLLNILFKITRKSEK